MRASTFACHSSQSGSGLSDGSCHTSLSASSLPLWSAWTHTPVHGGREPARADDHLPDQRHVEALGQIPTGVVDGRRQIALHAPGANDLPDDGRLLRRQAPDVLRNAPELLFGHELGGDQVLERRHRGSVEARDEPLVDLLDRAAAVEQPVLGEIGGANRQVVVVLQRGRRRPVASARLSVALVALDLLVELAAFRQRRFVRRREPTAPLRARAPAGSRRTARTILRWATRSRTSRSPK